MFEEKILSYLKKQKKRSFRKKDLATNINISEKNYSKFRNTLKRLTLEGKVVKHRGAKYAFPKNKMIITGSLRMDNSGFGFILPDELGKIKLGKGYLFGAVKGDIIKVKLNADPGKKDEGKIIEIIARTQLKIQGSIYLKNGSNYLDTHSPFCNRKISVNLLGQKISPEQFIEVKVDNWGDRQTPLQTSLIKIIGNTDDPGSDLDIIANKYNLRTEFSKSCLLKADQIAANTDFNDFHNRVDFREIKIVTIDPQSAKDFDDALSIELLENGRYELGVHIADVSHFIKENSVIDKEAKKRGTSVYFPDQSVPMLPKILTNNICSLKEKVNRYTVSAIIIIDKTGKVKSYKFCRSIINSDCRFTYEEVQSILEKQQGKSLELLNKLRDLAAILKRKRVKEGSLNFEIPEPIFKFGDNNIPISVHEKTSLESHNIVEEMMLLANQCVAKHLSKNRSIYRIHPKPPIEDLKPLVETLNYMGLGKYLDIKNIRGKDIQKLLKHIKNHSLLVLVENLLLRALPKAVYSTTNVGHFGLGFASYTHFTSPIRRYPDILVHRLLLNDFKNDNSAKIKTICVNSTSSEIIAMKAEREYTKIKQLRFLESQVTRTFNGLISGIIPSGLFIQLDDILVDGFINRDWLEDDYYKFNDKLHSFTGRKYKKKLQIGQKIKVIIRSISIPKRRLDLTIAG